MIEGQVVCRKSSSAVLTAELVAQENIEAGEGGVSGRGGVVFKGYDTGESEFYGWRSNNPVIFRYYIDPSQKHGPDGILPRPQGEREVTQGPEISIQDQGRGFFERCQQGRSPLALGTGLCDVRSRCSHGARLVCSCQSPGVGCC